MRYRDRQRWSTELSTVKEIDKLKQRPHTDCEGVPNVPKFPQHEDSCADADIGARLVRSTVQTALGLHLPSCSSLLKVIYRDSKTFEIQVVSKKKIVGRIMGPLFVTKIGCCWAKCCHEHHYGSIWSCLVLVRNNQIQFVTGSYKGQYKWLLGGDACYIALRILSVVYFRHPL